MDSLIGSLVASKMVQCYVEINFGGWVIFFLKPYFCKTNGNPEDKI